MRIIATQAWPSDETADPVAVVSLLDDFVSRQQVDNVQQAACLINRTSGVLLPIETPESVRFTAMDVPMTPTGEQAVFTALQDVAGSSGWSGTLEVRNHTLFAFTKPITGTSWSIAMALSDDDIRAAGMALVRPFYILLWIGMGVFVPLAIFFLHRSYSQVHAALLTAEQSVRVQGDRVRQQVGQDLHDGLGNLLTGASCLAKSLEMGLERRMDEAARDAREVRERIAEAIEGVRRCAKGLHPVEPGPDGVVRALESLAADIYETNQVNCLVESKPEVRITNPDVAMQVYLIAQSSIGNSIAHGKAKRITIRLDSTTDDRYTLEVEDDGLGLDSRDDAIYRGMGLSNVQYRAIMIRGHVSLNPSPTGGVLVRCQFERKLAEEQATEATRSVVQE